MDESISNREVIKLSAEMEAVKGDVATLADVIRDVTVRIDQKFEDILRTLDRRSNTGKQNTLTIIGILLPMGLAVGGILWALIDDIDDRVDALTKVHLQMQYDSGYSSAKLDAGNDKLGDMLRRVERLEVQKMSGPKAGD